MTTEEYVQVTASDGITSDNEIMNNDIRNDLRKVKSNKAPGHGNMGM